MYLHWRYYYTSMDILLFSCWWIRKFCYEDVPSTGSAKSLNSLHCYLVFKIQKQQNGGDYWYVTFLFFQNIFNWTQFRFCKKESKTGNSYLKICATIKWDWSQWHRNKTTAHFSESLIRKKTVNQFWHEVRVPNQCITPPFLSCSFLILAFSYLL